jgi:hypothetical protein
VGRRITFGVKMTDNEAHKLILDLIGEFDYDHVKYFDPEISEDPQGAEYVMKRLIKIVHKHTSTKSIVRQPKKKKASKKK